MKTILREIRDYICENATDVNGDYAPSEQEEQWMDVLDRLLAEGKPDPWKVGFVAAANILDQEDGRGPEAVRKFAAEYRAQFLDELTRGAQERGEYHICGPESSCDMDCVEHAEKTR